MRDPIPSVRKQNSNIPQSIENIIIKSTAKNPKNRYNDVKEMYRDLKVCLDEEIMNQDKIIYSYPEHESEDSKDPIPTIKSKKKEEATKKKDDNSDVEKIEEVAREIEVEEPKGKGMKIVIWSLVSILVLLLVVLACVFIPSFFGDVKEIEIPDVSGMSVVDAEAVLENAGLEVNNETEKMVSSEYEAGKVVRTDPIAGRSAKPGSVITIYESLGEETYTVIDYTGEDSAKIEGILVANGLDVDIVYEEVEDFEGVVEGIVIRQEPEAGTTLKKGDKVILYVPKMYERYPNFLEEEWTVEEVEIFAEKYNLIFSEPIYQPTNSYAPGTIYWQSREPGSEIKSGATLRIRVAIAIPVEEDNNIEDGSGDENSEGSTNDDENTDNGAN